MIIFSRKQEKLYNNILELIKENWTDLFKKMFKGKLIRWIFKLPTQIMLRNIKVMLLLVFYGLKNINRKLLMML